MRARNTWLALVAAVVLIGGGWAVAARNNDSATATPTPTATATSLAAVSNKFVSINVVEGKSALEALKAQQTVEVKSYSFGDMVTSINGLAATDTEGWSFYVNGTLATVGAGDYMPKTGDTIEFRYEKF